MSLLCGSHWLHPPGVSTPLRTGTHPRVLVKVRSLSSPERSVLMAVKNHPSIGPSTSHKTWKREMQNYAYWLCMSYSVAAVPPYSYNFQPKQFESAPALKAVASTRRVRNWLRILSPRSGGLQHNVFLLYCFSPWCSDFGIVNVELLHFPSVLVRRCLKGRRKWQDDWIFWNCCDQQWWWILSRVRNSCYSVRGCWNAGGRGRFNRTSKIAGKFHCGHWVTLFYKLLEVSQVCVWAIIIFQTNSGL